VEEMACLEIKPVLHFVGQFCGLLGCLFQWSSLQNGIGRVKIALQVGIISTIFCLVHMHLLIFGM